MPAGAEVDDRQPRLRQTEAIAARQRDLYAAFVIRAPMTQRGQHGLQGRIEIELSPPRQNACDAAHEKNSRELTHLPKLCPRLIRAIPCRVLSRPGRIYCKGTPSAWRQSSRAATRPDTGA